MHCHVSDDPVAFPAKNCNKFVSKHNHFSNRLIKNLINLLSFNGSSISVVFEVVVDNLVVARIKQCNQLEQDCMRLIVFTHFF